ncbi:MarR family winged helix-turn-helix transcriptional regulator [Nocardia sp. NPDC020380]|uniref:MarR family winged helix-turn-helix transcriptional regulator n=1 Tax=Nocardia sp. NPDC020380 TaxID=3364309 RepID=UPI0037BC56D7
MQLDDRNVFLMSQIGQHVADRLALALTPLGLHLAHFGVLSHLRATPGISQQELANRLNVHRNAMVGLIDDLEARGLVQRSRHPADRRAYAVQLTDTARAILRQAEEQADRLEADTMAPLSDAERAQLADLLLRIARHAELPSGVHPGLYSRHTGLRGSPGTHTTSGE